MKSQLHNNTYNTTIVLTADKNNQNSKVCMGSCRSFHMNKIILKIWSCWLCKICCIQCESLSCFNSYKYMLPPRKHAGSNSHLIWVGSEVGLMILPEVGLMILTYWLASGPDPFGQNLMQSARTKLDPCWSCTTWLRLSVEECIQVWRWETGRGPVAFIQNLATWFLDTDLLLDQIC